MIKNKNVLITGATSGIGEALALYYAKNGAKNLFICGRNESRLTVVAQKCRQLGTIAYPEIIDVTNREQMKSSIEGCERIAPLNLVFANAGSLPCRKPTKISTTHLTPTSTACSTPFCLQSAYTKTGWRRNRKKTRPVRWTNSLIK